MHAISSYRGNRPTDKDKHPHTHTETGPITIHCAAASAQCNDEINNGYVDYMQYQNYIIQNSYFFSKRVARFVSIS